MIAHHDQQGIILFFLLLILSVISVLILSLLQTVLIYSQGLNFINQQQKGFQQLEKIALTIMHQLPVDEECWVNDKTYSQMISHLIKGEGCIFNKSAYRYLLQNEGDFPCHMIHLHSRLYGSRHILLTLISNESIPHFLQVRIAKPVPASFCSLETKYLIEPGILTWRFLPKPNVTNRPTLPALETLS